MSKICARKGSIGIIASETTYNFRVLTLFYGQKLTWPHWPQEDTFVKHFIQESCKIHGLCKFFIHGSCKFSIHAQMVQFSISCIILAKHGINTDHACFHTWFMQVFLWITWACGACVTQLTCFPGQLEAVTGYHGCRVSGVI